MHQWCPGGCGLCTKTREPFTPTLMSEHLAYHPCPQHSSAISVYFFLFLSLASSICSSQGTVSSSMATCLDVSETSKLSDQSLVLTMAVKGIWVGTPGPPSFSLDKLSKENLPGVLSAGLDVVPLSQSWRLDIECWLKLILFSEEYEKNFQTE